MRFKNTTSWSSDGFRKSTINRRVLLVGFLLPLALDVRKIGDGGDSTLQILLITVTLFCGAIYMIAEWLSRDIRNSGSKLQIIVALWWAYIALSPLPVMLWGVDPVNYLKVLLPFVLFGIGLAIMLAVERRRVDPADLLDLLFWACLLSTAWRVVYAIAISGLSIETIRWQILGPGIPFLIGYGVGGLYLRRRRTLSAIALSVGLATILLSITRSYIIGASVVLVGLLIVDSRRRSARHAALTGARLLVPLTVIAAITVVITAGARPDFLEGWVARLFHQRADSGLDITLVTRLAEYRGQINAMTRSFGTLLLGNGVGADYTWDADILRGLPFEVELTTRWFAGHSTWVYPFFASGLLLGAVIPFVLLRGLHRAFIAAAANTSEGGFRNAVLEQRLREAPAARVLDAAA